MEGIGVAKMAALSNGKGGGEEGSQFEIMF
jgi:hypothetical protein